MIPYNLPNGKTIYIKLDDLLDDDKLEKIILSDQGSFIEDNIEPVDLDTDEILNPIKKWSSDDDLPFQKPYKRN